MIISIYRENGTIIKVLSSITSERIYKNKKIYSILINNNYYLKKRDKVEYICDSCGKKETQIFKFAEKFFEKEILCTACLNIKKYGTPHYLSSYSVIEKREATNLSKYGTKNVFQSEEVKDKIKQTNLDRYGVENVSQSELIKKKIRKTNMQNLGVPYPMMNLKVLKKSQETCLKKYGAKSFNLIGSFSFRKRMIELYGTENASLSEEISDKRKELFMEKYGGPSPFYSNDISQKANESYRKNHIEELVFSDKLKDYEIISDIRDEYKTNTTLLTFKCKKCNTIFDDTTLYEHPRCPTCYPKLYMGVSNTEKEIYTFITSLGIEATLNDYSVISPKELDIYIPSHKLAIEFDGLYWHSELQGKDKYYHLNKTKLCAEKNISLIHIFADEWICKREIVESILKTRLGFFDKKIGARKCLIKEIDSLEAAEFYDKNHLQGVINSSINIGLYYQDELVSCLSFAKPRFNKKYDYEITRFANVLNTTISGSFTKLLSYFLNNYDGSIITYSDKRFFAGKIYENNGFKKLKDSPPSYYYTDFNRRYSRMAFQKHKLAEKLDTYDPKLTEWENMQINKYDRIWDCGNYVFEYIR